MKPHALNFYSDRAPKKKFRGRHRYFERLKERTESFRLAITDDSWWDQWHYHVDWPGWGNLGWRYRLPHFRGLCAVFREVSNCRDQFRTPFQSWILINGEDAGQDAVFLHSPNRNRSEFPIRVESIEPNASGLAPVFQGLLPELELTFGWSTWRDEDGQHTAHWIAARGLGVPVWEAES